MMEETPRDPIRELENSVNSIMDEFCYVVAATGRAEQFIDAMKKRAEIAARTFIRTPAEYRDMAAGQISICYELADRAKSALDAKASLATDAEVNRIRKEVAAMK